MQTFNVSLLVISRGVCNPVQLLCGGEVEPAQEVAKTFTKSQVMN